MVESSAETGPLNIYHMLPVLTVMLGTAGNIPFYISRTLLKFLHGGCVCRRRLRVCSGDSGNTCALVPPASSMSVPRGGGTAQISHMDDVSLPAVSTPHLHPPPPGNCSPCKVKHTPNCLLKGGRQKREVMWGRGNKRAET